MGNKKQRRRVPVGRMAGFLMTVILALELVLMSGWLETSRLDARQWLLDQLGVDYTNSTLQAEQSVVSRSEAVLEERESATEVKAIEPMIQVEESIPRVEEIGEELKPVDDSVPVG